jgi:hypothetical protein
MRLIAPAMSLGWNNIIDVERIRAEAIWFAAVFTTPTRTLAYLRPYRC